MWTLEITFEDGVVGHLDFKSEDQVKRWLPMLAATDVMERHRAVSYVIIPPKKNSAVAEAA
jgi:hypothetical protein